MAAPRRLARLAMPIMVGAILAATPAIAAATTPHDDEFLARMRGLGFVWPPQEDGDIVTMAHQICIDRWNGFSQDALAQDIHNNLGPKGVNIGDASAMITLTESMYCPY